MLLGGLDTLKEEGIITAALVVRATVGTCGRGSDSLLSQLAHSKSSRFTRLDVDLGLPESGDGS